MVNIRREFTLALTNIDHGDVECQILKHWNEHEIKKAKKRKMVNIFFSSFSSSYQHLANSHARKIDVRKHLETRHISRHRADVCVHVCSKISWSFNSLRALLDWANELKIDGWVEEEEEKSKGANARVRSHCSRVFLLSSLSIASMRSLVNHLIAFLHISSKLWRGEGASVRVLAAAAGTMDRRLLFNRRERERRRDIHTSTHSSTDERLLRECMTVYWVLVLSLDSYSSKMLLNWWQLEMIDIRSIFPLIACM